MSKFINIIFADDKDLWRQMLIQDLVPFDIRCTGEARNGKELLKLLKTQTPDVVLLDLSMPVMDGNEAMQAIQNMSMAPKVIVLSMHNDDELVDDYMARGAKGYISKDAVTVNVLVEAINAVHQGQTYIYKLPMARRKYSPRQIEMIPLICEGLTNKEIAEEIGISERGVEKQRQKIYEKAGAKKAVDFYKYAFKQGLDFLYRSLQWKRN